MDNRDAEAMTVNGQGHDVVTRIGFAERWLHRARAQVADGNVTLGLANLALADAEVRYALEAGGWLHPAAHTARPVRRRLSGWGLAAVAAVLAVAWMSLRASVPTVAGDFEGPPIVRFPAHIGTLLESMASPLPKAAVADHAAGRRTGPPVIRIGNRTTASPLRTGTAASATGQHPTRASTNVAPVPTPASPPTMTPGTALAPTQSVATPFVLSEVDLIDMVLAASRALQGTGP